MRAASDELDREKAIPVAIALTLVLSLGAHLVIYLFLEPVFVTLIERPAGDADGVAYFDVVGDGEESGEPGDALEDQAEMPESAPVPAAPTPPRRRAAPVPERVDPPEEVDAPEAIAVPAEDPEVAETEEEAAAPSESTMESDVPNPTELANRLLIEQLTGHSRGPGGAGGGAGTGTGAGAGGFGCSDPIAGTWRARRYNPGRQSHAVFTLRIARDGERLTGQIINRAWNGGRSQRSPPYCSPGVWSHTVTMPARGRINGTNFRFDGLSHRRTSHCVDFGMWSYNLDHFTGTLQNDTLRVVNNDGGWEINAPYTFRRVDCGG
ncbi:MAG: hypothetical protein AAGE52_08875 [Myxococcota bacterium]